MTDHLTPPHTLPRVDFDDAVWMLVPGMTAEYGVTGDEPRHETLVWESADVVTSIARHARQVHRPTLDLDMPVKVYPSETPGHHHLVIDHPMPWDDYRRLLEVMADVGLLERGYVNASIGRGHTSIATRPWKEARDIRVGQAQHTPTPKGAAADEF